jgi:hypothetical protein
MSKEGKADAMVQLAMVLTGLTAGVKAKGWRRAVAVVLVVFAAVLAIQTALVASDDGLRSTADNLIYWPVQDSLPARRPRSRPMADPLAFTPSIKRPNDRSGTPLTAQARRADFVGRTGWPHAVDSEK